MCEYLFQTVQVMHRLGFSRQVYQLYQSVFFILEDFIFYVAELR